MSNITPTPEISESEQIDLVAAYLRSGLTQKSFCKWRGIKMSVFKGWLCRYKGCVNGTIEKDRLFSPPVDAPSSLFKVLKVQEEESPPTVTPVAATLETASPAAPRVPTLRIEKNLFSIKVPKGFDKETLLNILSVMQTLP
jgi:hypothetical protein